MSTLTWSFFFFNLWGKEGKGVVGFWTLSTIEEDKKSLRDGKLEESFLLSSSWSEDEFEGESFWESLPTPSGASPEPLIGEEEGEEF